MSHNRNRRSSPTSREEILQKQIRRDGQGEDPVVQALVSKEFGSMPNSEALQIALQLQAILSGQQSLLANQDKYAQELARLQQRMDARDQADAKWEQDRKSFIEDVLSKAEGLRPPTPEGRDRLQAKGAEQVQQAMAQARVDAANRRLMFANEIANGPKETIISAGELEMSSQNGQPVMVQFEEQIKIMDRTWSLPIGVPTVVPKVVADVWRQKQRTREELRRRGQAISAQGGNMREDRVAFGEWEKINQEFGSGTESIPTSG
jgi:hypothetical protein